MMEKENLSDKAAKVGGIIVNRMKELQRKYPQIGDVRGLGSMVAIELVKDPLTKEPHKEAVSAIIQECFKRGLLTMGAGIFGNVIRFLPPLVITDEQLEAGLKIFEKSLGQVLGK
jgi:4-aminobutyrate aminotransferase/(S)-3-amino-2-methylpropionate transaminase